MVHSEPVNTNPTPVNALTQYLNQHFRPDARFGGCATGTQAPLVAWRERWGEPKAWTHRQLLGMAKALLGRAKDVAKSPEEAIERLQPLLDGAINLHRLADVMGFKTNDKGRTGMVIERLLGLPTSSKPLPDAFWGEVKMMRLGVDHQVRFQKAPTTVKMTKLCAADLNGTFQDSRLYCKGRRMLCVLVAEHPWEKGSQYVVGAVFFDLQHKTLLPLLNQWTQDYLSIQAHCRKHPSQKGLSSIGKLVQARTASGGRAFYLRTQGVRVLLEAILPPGQLAP